LTSTGKIKVLLVAAVAALALGAVSASSASASIVNAKFSSSSWKLTASSVTVTRNGTESKSCKLVNPIEGFAEGSGFLAMNEWTGESIFTCTDGSTLVMRYSGEAKYDTVAGRYYLHISSYNEALASPWGPHAYFQSTSDWTWVNGSGATFSTMSPNALQIGLSTPGSQKITVTGTITAKTSTGGLVTLSH
jgi:hypothetical protein